METLNPGKNSKPRIDFPDGYECHQYSGQKNNIYEVQKNELRKLVAKDKAHFYTYSKDFLGGAFPVVNENEEKIKEIAAS